MKISKTSILLFGLLFCGFTVDCSRTNGDDKIKLKIEVLNRDELLSPSHLKVQKHIVHNGKKINMKMFEKIDGQVLERAFVVEEIDKTRGLSNSQKAELLSLENSEDDSEENIIDEDIIEDPEDNTEEDGKMKIISTEESKENDVHMIRKIYKETLGNKEITYCYMIFNFNLDLEKLNEVSRSELFKSLDSMPDYLSFLSPNEKISDTENLLEEEYEQLQEDSGNHSNFSGMSATELSHDSEDIEVNIAKYITTLDDIINYVVSKSEDSHKLPVFYNELLREREYLYKLSLERTKNEDVADEEYWKNKSKVDKYFLFEALTHLKNFFFNNSKIRAHYNELKGDDNLYDASIEYKAFVDLTDKTIKCHTLLDTTEILDFVILQNMEHAELHSANENKEDKELIEQCITLFKLLLNNKEDMIELIKDRNMNDSNMDIKDTEEQENGTQMRGNRKTFDELESIAEEKFPAKRYMLRKEAPENDEIKKSLEDEESEENDYDSQGMYQELDGDIIDEIGEADELYEDPEDDFTNEIISDMPEEEFTDEIISDTEDGEFIDDIISDMPEEEFTGEITSDIPEKEFTTTITSDIPEKKNRMSHVNFLEYDNEISKNNMETEMFDEDSDIADESEEEHQAEISEVLNLEKEKMLNDEMNKTIDSNEEFSEELNGEITSDTPVMEYKKNLTSSMEFNGEESNDEIATEMFNEDPDIADETEEEHEAEILEVLNLEKEKLLNDEMKNTEERSIKPHNEMMTSSYLENELMIQDGDTADDAIKTMVSANDVNDMFSIDADNEDAFGENEDETTLDQDDEEQDDDGDDEDDVDDGDDDDGDDDNDEEDDDVDDDDDDNDEEEEVPNEKFTDKLKKKAKKGFKSVLNKGKDMAKNALSTLVDKAENGIKELTNKASNKIKSKLGKSKSKKNSKKNKKNGNKKSVKKSSSKGIKKDKKKGKKGSKSKGDNLRTPAKAKKGKKSPKAASSLEIQDMSSDFENSNMEYSYIDLADASSKKSLGGLMNRIMDDYKQDKANIRDRTHKSSKKIEPMTSEKEFVKVFEQNGKKRQNKSGKNFKKAMSSLETQDMSTDFENSNTENSSYIDLGDASSKKATNGRIKHVIENIKEEMSNLESNKRILLKELEEPTVSDEEIIKDFEKYSQKEEKKKEKRLKN